MKGRTRTLEVVHSGMVLVSDGQGHGRPARLILTKEQLLIQINDKGIVEGSTTNLGPIVDLQPELTVNTVRTIMIEKGKEGIGLSIKGGCEGGNKVPVVISKVIPNTPAARTNRLFVGDAIVEINGTSVDGKTHDEVVQMLRESPANQVVLTVKGETVLGPLLRRSSSKRLSGSIPDSTLELNVKPTISHVKRRGLIATFMEDHKSSAVTDDYCFTIFMGNRQIEISYIGWIEERMPDGYFEDPKLRWEQRFIIFKGSDLCVFESPPLDSEELDKCVCLYKVYETTLMTAIKKRDRRDHVFAMDTNQGQMHYFSVQSVSQLQQLEAAYYNSVYKSVSSLQSRTFACSHEGRPAGLVFDIKQGISLYDIPTKKYIWQYGFHDMESSSDDGKLRIQLAFRDESQQGGVQHLTKEIECDQVITVVFTLHAFFLTKIMGADPEYLKTIPLGNH